MCCGQDYIASGLSTSELCGEFLAYRPAGTQDLFVALAISQLRGDPHITTLDNVIYTFNGHGEFTLITDTDNSNFTLQVRCIALHFALYIAFCIVFYIAFCIFLLLRL